MIVPRVDVRVPAGDTALQHALQAAVTQAIVVTVKQWAADAPHHLELNVIVRLNADLAPVRITFLEAARA